MDKNQRNNGNSNYLTALKIIAPMLIVAFILVANLIVRMNSKDVKATLLIEEAYAPSFIADIAGAKKSIACAMYMFKVDDRYKNSKDDPIALIYSSFIKAASRGVDVAIVFDISREDDLTTKFNSASGKLLEESGIKVFFDSSDSTMHTKMCVIDGTIVYLGSHNFTYSAMKRNSEVSVKIVSKELARDALKYLDSISVSPDDTK